MPTLLRLVAGLALLTLLVPVSAIAGPPEGASTRLVLDEVSEGLRQYRKESAPEQRLRRLEKLAATGDPRVYVALLDFDYSDVPKSERQQVAHEVVLVITAQPQWWGVSHADMRRRASQLPR